MISLLLSHSIYSCDPVEYFLIIYNSLKSSQTHLTLLPRPSIFQEDLQSSAAALFSYLVSSSPVASSQLLALGDPRHRAALPPTAAAATQTYW